MSSKFCLDYLFDAETEDGGQRTKREKRKEKQEEVYGVETFEKGKLKGCSQDFLQDFRIL